MRLRLDPTSPSGVAVVSSVPSRSQGQGYVTKIQYLAELQDTNAANPSDGQALTWNAASGKWIPATSGDSRYAQLANNLSDLPNASTARTNLGLGTIATKSTITLTTDVTGILPIANGGTGSSTQNFVDLSTTQSSIGGSKTFTGSVSLNGALSAGSVGFRSPPSIRSANVTLANASPWLTYMNASAGARTVTLPAANASNGQILFVMKIDSSANAVTVQAAGTDTVNGAASVSLSAQYKYIEVVNDNGSNWYIKGSN